MQDVRVGPQWSAASLDPDPSRGPLKAPRGVERQQAGLRLPQKKAGRALRGGRCTVAAHSDDKFVYQAAVGATARHFITRLF